MWLHHHVLLGIIFRGLVIVIAAQPKGRREGGENTDAQTIFNLVQGIVSLLEMSEQNH